MRSPLDKPIKPPQEQAHSASKRRAAVAAIVFGAGAKGMSVTEVVHASGMPRETVNKILAKLRASGVLVSVSQARNAAMRLYAPEFVPADPAPAAAAEEPAQVAGPRTFHPFAQPATYSAVGLQPVRSGAQDHLAVPSRRGDERVPHQPMMCMGSSVGGGAS